MTKINWRRKPKIRKPVPMKPNKVITPDTVYDRNKTKELMHKIVEKYRHEEKE